MHVIVSESWDEEVLRDHRHGHSAYSESLNLIVLFEEYELCGEYPLKGLQALSVQNRCEVRVSELVALSSHTPKRCQRKA